MSPKPELPSPGSRQLLFVTAYHNLPGISEGEWIAYFATEETNRLRQELASYINHQLDLFSVNSDYAEYFSLADYDNPADSISDSEVEAFRSALSPAERHTSINDLDSYELLRGFRAVILSRIASGDLTETRSVSAGLKQPQKRQF